MCGFLQTVLGVISLNITEVYSFYPKTEICNAIERDGVFEKYFVFHVT